MRISSLLPAVALSVLLLPLQAQTPPAPSGRSLVPAFEPERPQASLWYGVDAGGVLAGNTQQLPVLNLDGTISGSPMPVSVSVADMNADGLPDIVTMDVLGYLRIYFNSGTKSVPKFSTGELSTLFLTRTSAVDQALPLPLKDSPWWVANPVRDIARRGPRIFVFDRMGATKNDLFIGNYSGEILLIPNTGTPSVPEFKQPQEIARAVIPTMKDSQKKWGNVFAPTVWDWDGDGRFDLLVGEGSYSANSIHLLINKGANDRPVFDENNRSVLAYGMGLEQLSPCVVDFNGDGFPDLLVTERSGKVAVYLNSGKPWKPGETLAFDSFLKVGAPAAPGSSDTKPDPMTAATAPNLLPLGGISTIAAADLNGDGLFDLIFGKSNGRVAVSLNTGTKTQPAFSAPVDIISETKPTMVALPRDWECDSGLTRGNFFGYVSLVSDADDPDAKISGGGRCLKAGYLPCLNKIMAPPSKYSAAFAGWDRKASLSIHEPSPPFGAPADFFHLKYPANWRAAKVPLKMKTPYVLSMRVKGTGLSDGAIAISYFVQKDLSEAKMVRGDRGAVTVLNRPEERKNEVIKFTATAQWAEIKKEFVLKFDNKEFGNVTEVLPKDWAILINFDLAPGAGTLYIDDVKLIEK